MQPRLIKISTIIGIVLYLFLILYSLWNIANLEVRRIIQYPFGAGFILLLIICLAGLIWILFRKPDGLSELQERIGRVGIHVNHFWQTLLYLLLLFSPVVITFIGFDGDLLRNPWVRVSLIIPFVLTATLFFPGRKEHDYFHSLSLTILFTAYLFMLAGYFSRSVNYPFSLTWSEGNRLYDYSLTFGKDLYKTQGELSIPYFAPGRYGLWGVIFLIKNAPIALHRLWDALLWTLPPLLFGLVVAKNIRPWRDRLGWAVWVALFIDQGPVYAPILFAAIPTLIPDRPTLWKRAIPVGLASLYAGISRWTWSIAPGAWAGLVDFFRFYPTRTGNWFRRIWPVLVIGLVGSLPGLVANLPRWLDLQESTFSLSQPLLFYRLFPNSTNSNGILLSMVINFGTVMVLLCWLVLSKKWRLDAWQILAGSLVCIGSLVAGLIASIKIGGGNNLHNMDMFIISIIILVGLFIESHPQFSFRSNPGWIQLVILMAFIIPVWNATIQPYILKLPEEAIVREALQVIQKEVDRTKGEILFIDQRQLLTFGTLRGIELVSEYEKKFLMDQAMAGNRDFFRQFYEDLEQKRFSLIISEPLFLKEKLTNESFSEENNAWTLWVSKPLLCYFQPRFHPKLSEFNIKLLFPRKNTQGCQEMIDRMLLTGENESDN